MIHQVKEAIGNKSEELKDLNARAAGEVVIRQALSELDTWEVDAKFTLLPHTDSKGNQVMLIKEWKDIINKVKIISIIIWLLMDAIPFRRLEITKVSFNR